MKIAFFSESYKPYVSGVTNSIETLKNGLEELGHKVFVFSPSYPGAEEMAGVYRFPSIPAPYPGYRITIPVPGRYFDFLESQKINIIHSHSPYQLGRLSMSYAKRLGVPYVFTMHTVLGHYMHYVPFIPQRISSFLMSRYSKGFCNKCSSVVVPTDKVKKQLRSEGITSRIEVIPTGIDMTLIDNASPIGIRQMHGIPADAKVLLFVGRLAKEKNLPFLFKAFETVLSKHSNVFLLVAAGGPMELELKKIAPANVVFAGSIGYPRIFDYYAASDVFVFSSLSETQGLVLTEAKASGIPQVAVDAEGVSDVVKDGITGYLVPPDEDVFAFKVMKLMEDRETWKRMSSSSKDIARLDDSKEVFARKIELLYKSVI